MMRQAAWLLLATAGLGCASGGPSPSPPAFDEARRAAAPSDLRFDECVRSGPFRVTVRSSGEVVRLRLARPAGERARRIIERSPLVYGWVEIFIEAQRYWFDGGALDLEVRWDASRGRWGWSPGSSVRAAPLSQAIVARCGALPPAADTWRRLWEAPAASDRAMTAAFAVTHHCARAACPSGWRDRAVAIAAEFRRRVLPHWSLPARMRNLPPGPRVEVGARQVASARLLTEVLYELLPETTEDVAAWLRLHERLDEAGLLGVGGWQHAVQLAHRLGGDGEVTLLRYVADRYPELVRRHPGLVR